MKIIKRNNFGESGITLIALVVTIIVLLILAGITIRLALNNNGIINRARDASETYSEAEENELRQMEEFAEQIDELSGATALSEDKIAAVNSRIKDPEQELQEVEYEAKENEKVVTVQTDYSGIGIEYKHTQSNAGATGNNRVKWYVLNADENGVNIVSDILPKTLNLSSAPAYDNLLFYMNKISKELFTNEEYGIKEDRIHALRLSDIKKAAETINNGTKIEDNGELREWSWDTDFVNKSTAKSYYFDTTHTYTNEGRTYHPAIYPVKDGTTEVEINNVMFDEEPGELIALDNIKREENGNPASKLTAKGTYFNYFNHKSEMMENLCSFGKTQIANNLLGNDAYTLATRCIDAQSSNLNFNVFSIHYNTLTYDLCCDSSGSGNSTGFYFRVVISVPSSNVRISDDGTVTLKSKNA